MICEPLLTGDDFLLLDLKHIVIMWNFFLVARGGKYINHLDSFFRAIMQEHFLGYLTKRSQKFDPEFQKAATSEDTPKIHWGNPNEELPALQFSLPQGSPVSSYRCYWCLIFLRTLKWIFTNRSVTNSHHRAILRIVDSPYDLTNLHFEHETS